MERDENRPTTVQRHRAAHTGRALVALALTASLCLSGRAVAGALPEIGDNSGAFTHSVPIAVPDGPSGATPELQLLYSSAGGNGNAGVGWSLPYSAIRLDQSWGVPAYWLDGADPCDPESFEGRLWLDGQELIPSRHDPLAPERCTYRTRPDSFSLVVPIDAEHSCTSPQGPDIDLPTGYAVVRNAGSTWWYGSTSCDSPYVDRAEDGTPTRWLLQHVQDRDGNLVTYWPERGTGPAGDVGGWWTGSPVLADDTAGCDGCLRGVTWAARSKDATGYAFDATILGSPASSVFVNGAPQPYSSQQAGLTGKFGAFLNDPGQHWPSSQSHYYAVKVDWEARPDVRTSFMSGAPQRLDRRIRQIAVFANVDVEHADDGHVAFKAPQTTIRTFRLDYDQGSTGRSRLTRVWPISGMYEPDADYSGVFGNGFPLTGFDAWDPMAFSSNPLIPNPWEFVWSDSTTLDPDQEEGPILGDYEEFLPIEGSSLPAHAPVPWMGANWREGGYPTITMMDLNGDSLPEIVQHDELLPKYLSAADNLMDLFNPYADYVFGADEPGVANDGVASKHFWVRWNQGDGFTDLEEGPLDPFALQEVADYIIGPDPEDPEATWDLPTTEELLEDEDFDLGTALDLDDYWSSAGIDGLCGLWWTGGHSAGQVPGFPEPLAAWCEHRSCAPFCEAGTTITTGPNSRSDQGFDTYPIDNLLQVQTTRPATLAAGTGGELVLWRKYAVTRATSGSAAATVADPPFNIDTLLTAPGGSPLEPRTITRWVDGYARPSFQTRVASTNVELLRAGKNYQGTIEPAELNWLTVRDGLVHDTIDINGDGYPDRVLGGAGVLEHDIGTSTQGYVAPHHAIFNSDGSAPKDLVVSTQHIPWFVALYDPDLREFGDLQIWELPLDDQWMLGGSDVFPDPFLNGQNDPRLFSDFGNTADFNFLGIWESTAEVSPAPVSGGASASFGPTGVSAGLSASIGPVSIGGSISGSGPGFSVGVGPVSFTSGGMSIGPVNIQYGRGVQTGGAAAAAAVWFVIAKALEVLEVPWQVGHTATPAGISASAGPFGGDCITCKTTARYKRQGLADLNGDGLLDFVIAEPVTVAAIEAGIEDWLVVLNEGDGFAGEPILWPGVQADYMDLSLTDPYRKDSTGNSRFGFRRSHKVAGLQDLNADGLADFVYTGLRSEDGCEPPEQKAVTESSGPANRWLRGQNAIDAEKHRITLCVQLNSGAGFEAPVDWFDGTVPPELFDAEPGFVPALSGTHMLVERSPLYSDGYGVEIIGLRDWNGDGLADLYRMDPYGTVAEAREPVIYLNDGRRFVTTPVTTTERYGQLTLDTWSMRDEQELSTAAHDVRFTLPHPMFDINRTHRRPGGNVVQSSFVDLNGDGRLDWAQSDEGLLWGDGRRHDVGIRLYPLQNAVPDVLTQLWEPGGATQRMTYRPARDFMDLPHAPDPTTLPDGTSLTDDVEDVYPASAQVLTSTVIYDGLGTRGSAPVAVAYQYGDPDFVHADPALTAGLGLTHPSFRRRPLGFARVTAQPCEAITDYGCKEIPEVTIVQEYGTDWMTAALPFDQRVIDSNGVVRSRAVTHWDATTFDANYDADPRPESALGRFNWHFAPALSVSEAFDEAQEVVRSSVAVTYDERNGMAVCTGTDLDGDDWVDRVEWTDWDDVYIDDGKRDAAEISGVSMLPLGQQNVLDEADCGERSEVQSNNYAVRRTAYERHPSGRVALALTQDVATGEQLAESFDYLPNGMPYWKTDAAGTDYFTLYEPTTAVVPISEVAPPNFGAGVEFVSSREVCGLTTSCAPASWGQVTEETEASGRTVFTEFDQLGRPIVSGDDVHPEVAEMTYARPLRLVGVDEEPVGFGGGLPAYVAAMKPVAPGLELWTHSWTDGLGRTLLMAEEWEDEAGQPGQRIAGGEVRDFRGRVEETPWPCFVPGGGLVSQADWLQYQPGAVDLGLCADVPPRDTYQYDDLSRVVTRVRPDQAEINTAYRHYGGALVTDVELVQGGAPLGRSRIVTTPVSKWTTRFDAVTHEHDTGPTLPAGVIAGPSELHTMERVDAMGRRTEVWRTGQGSESTTFAFDGFDRLVAYADPDQGSWELDYDLAGRPEARRLVDPLTGATDLATEWKYDDQGRVLTERSYDDATAWMSGQASSWWEWTYDVDPGPQATPMASAGGEIGRAGLAMRRTAACGGGADQVLSWRYDLRGRPVEEAFASHGCAWQPTGAPAKLVAQHEWTAGDAKARSWMPWSGEEVSWVYDGAGRPQAVADSSGKLAEATYEIHGRLASLSFSNGALQEYAYATGNTSTQALTDSWVWDSTGGTLFDRHYEWDAAGNLRQWVDQATVGPQGEDWQCEYDGVGTLLNCRNGMQGEWFDYSYDPLGNLISEDVQVDGESRWASQYARGTGGMTSLPGMTAPLNAPVARVVGPSSGTSPTDPGQSFFYDGRGHLVAQRYHAPHDSAQATVTTAGLTDPNLSLLPHIWERQFAWNAKGRLDSVTVQAMSTHQEVSRYWYGPGGNRIAERVTPLASEPDPTWVQSRRWAGIRTVEPELEDPRFTLSITLGSTVVAQKTVEPNPLGQPTETVRWLGGDHLGSASIVTDENGALVRGVRYEPYGRIRDEWGPEAATDDYAIGGVDDLFNGKPRTRKAFGLSGLMGGDYELEGYDYGARIYLPELSRWASADSITPDMVWEANAFAYVRNNPLRYRDPDGHSARTLSAEEAADLILHGPPAEPQPTWQILLELVPGVGEGADLMRALGWDPLRWRRTSKSERSAAGHNFYYSVTTGLFLRRIKGLGDVYQVARRKPKVHGVPSMVKKFLARAPKGGPGRWGRDLSESMSEASGAFQRQVTGAPIGAVYRVGGKKFDGFDGQFLLDAKGDFSHFLKNGDWAPWGDGGVYFLRVARGQVKAAGSTPIKWVFMQKEVADKVRALLQANNLGNIVVEHVAPK